MKTKEVTYKGEVDHIPEMWLAGMSSQGWGYLEAIEHWFDQKAKAEQWKRERGWGAEVTVFPLVHHKER